MQPVESSEKTCYQRQFGGAVSVTIDGTPKNILPHSYTGLELKSALSVAAEYELEAIESGHFCPIGDRDRREIHGHEKFVSHVRCGGSS